MFCRRKGRSVLGGRPESRVVEIVGSNFQRMPEKTLSLLVEKYELSLAIRNQQSQRHLRGDRLQSFALRLDLGKQPLALNFREFVARDVFDNRDDLDGASLRVPAH